VLLAFNLCHGKNQYEPEEDRDGVSRGHVVGWRSLLAYNMGDFEDVVFSRLQIEREARLSG